ncbi:hypothetical protein PAXRUDRAFT_177277 [Paxillus rubicundulus Ve08.2h10]|uniref:Uncharacterized protein n=1 Tax=Paxillus rubicundulus Ve08.2h10 TaxID=930991 RepID=A0A0D0BQQ5_9AGAM|nr:hypothetical protein PAXRUDRAFT_177277 [Paxillus rubicundulus Ve08.2h10]
MSVDDAATARQARLQGATTLEGVLAFVPADFREVLRDPLQGIANIAEKLASTRATLSKWQAHKAAGTLPPHLKSKVPEVQLTKGYREAAEGAAVKASFIAKHQKFCSELLDDSLRAKKDEMLFLEKEVSPARIYEQCAPLIKEAFELLNAKTKLPVLETDDEGNITLKGWTDNTLVQRNAQEVIHDCVIYGLRIVNISNNRNLSKALVAEKKKALHQAADVDMKDGTSGSGATIQSLVDKAVAAQMKKLAGKPNKGKGKATSTSERPLPERTPYVPPNPCKARAKARAAAKGPQKKKKQSSSGPKGKGKGKGKQ